MDLIEIQDKLIQLMGDMNIPVECQDEMKKYKKLSLCR